MPAVIIPVMIQQVALRMLQLSYLFSLGTLSPNPWDLTLLGQNSCGRGGAAAHSGAWVDAQVASLRCLIPRPGVDKYRIHRCESKKKLPEKCWWSITGSVLPFLLAGFEVSLVGRFSGVPRGN